MVDMLVATVAFVLVVVVALAVLVAITVVPLYLAAQMAERRGFSPGRWALVTAVGIAAGLAYTYLLSKHRGIPLPVKALPLGLTWTGPGTLWLLEAKQTRIGGRAGRHE